MKRNPDAHCGNCPYFWADGHNDRDGYCRRHPIPESVIHGEDYWCGEHPDFELHGHDLTGARYQHRSTD